MNTDPARQPSPTRVCNSTVWGAPAEAAFRALARHGLGEDDADVAYVQIGAVARPEAALPAALLRSRDVRFTGSGAGSASVTEVTTELPAYMERIADRSIIVPHHAYPLSRTTQAWTATQTSGTRIVVVPD